MLDDVAIDSVLPMQRLHYDPPLVCGWLGLYLAYTDLDDLIVSATSLSFNPGCLGFELVILESLVAVFHRACLRFLDTSLGCT